MNLGLRLDHQIGRLKLSKTLSFVVLSIPSALLILLTLLKALDMKTDAFHENSFITFLGCAKLQLIYICLANNNDLIIETMDQIEEIVHRSIF